MPVPNAAAIHWAYVIYEKSEGNDVEDEEEEIGWPVEEAIGISESALLFWNILGAKYEPGGEREEEDEREENADGRNDLSVDKALLRPC
jgi:hypothetical protein